MTLLKPTLRVNRLIVFQGGHAAFDGAFHMGVNILRGRNSSGKTTIMDLLAFSLGAENIRWKPEALICSQTIVEVQLNYGVACLSRDIGEESMRPMRIYWGGMEKALVAGSHEWERYSFRRTENQSSFSQAIFTALEMPLAKGDGASNLTMHQLLRVLYADQPSVHSPIFRDDIFDSSLTRQVVGGYLSGVYDDDLYSAQLKIRDLEIKLNRCESELKGIYKVLGKSGQTPDLEFSNDQIDELNLVRDELTKQIEQLKIDRTLPRKDANKARAKADGLRAKLNEARKNQSQMVDELAALDLDVGDSLLFIREIEERIKSLDESKDTRAYLGNLEFRFCPSCLSDLKDDGMAENQCHLCTSSLDGGKSDGQMLRMRNELAIQLSESRKIVDEYQSSSDALRRDIPIIGEEIKRLEKEYKAVASSWSSEVEIVLEETARKLGAIDEEIRQAHGRQKLAAVIADLQKDRDLLSSELAGLNEKIIALKQQQMARQLEVNGSVEKAMIRLLKQDLPLQPEFVNPKNVDFSFENNAVYVNKTRNFSESSAVVLRHIFHLALLTASMQRPYMRLPHFMMLDGIDDGGMEKNRSHKLQEIIVNECVAYRGEYQVIFATSDISPELEGTEYVVGRAFSSDHRSLDVRPI
ncbi:AAA family ATPase [Burkholderia sp. 22PA0106]|uniref:AAA family ATPase n=1 Tax=Burkholderia sp. 22PA0106 TaxID=3237371 RepID=UPI0039C422D7